MQTNENINSTMQDTISMEFCLFLSFSIDGTHSEHISCTIRFTAKQKLFQKGYKYGKMQILLNVPFRYSELKQTE